MHILNYINPWHDWYKSKKFWFFKSSLSSVSGDNIISKASSYLGTNALRPNKLSESVIKSSSTSIKKS